METEACCLVCSCSLDLESFDSRKLIHVAFILGYIFQVPHQVLENSLAKLLIKNRDKDSWDVRLLCSQCSKLVQNVVDIHEEILESSERLLNAKQEIVGRRKNEEEVVSGEEVESGDEVVSEDEEDGGNDSDYYPEEDDEEMMEVEEDDGGDDDNDPLYCPDEDVQRKLEVAKGPRKRGRSPKPEAVKVVVIRPVLGKGGRTRTHPPRETRPSKFRRLTCPVCSEFRCTSGKVEALCEHLQNCTGTDDNQDEDEDKKVGLLPLTCPICTVFQCANLTVQDKIGYAEHVGCCQGDVEEGKRMIIPLWSRIFVCNICPEKKFMKLEEFLEHFVYHKKCIFKCAYSGGCNIRTYSTGAMMRHWRVYHYDDPESGKKVIPPTSRYSEDFALPTFSWYCPFCSDRFPDEDSRDAHLKTDHVDESQQLETTHKCEWCPKGYSSSDELKLHQGTEHVSKSNFFECDQCNETFATEKLMEQHSKRVHRVVHLKACHLCGVPFKNDKELKAHVKNEHKKPKKEAEEASEADEGGGVREKYKCKECIASFPRRDQLTYHKRRNHYNPEDGNSLECPHCKKIFYNPHNLRVHVESIHEKKFRFTCHICGQGCASSTNLKRHLTRTHQVGNYGQTKCPEKDCSKVFPNRFKLNVHIARDHKKEPRFKCEYCGKGFYIIEQLRTHLLIHTHPDVKPFYCKLCPKKRFRVGAHLMLHWRTHPETERTYLKGIGVTKD